MLWLVVCAILSFGFGQLFKWSQRRGRYAPAVVAFNYVVVAAVLGGYQKITGNLGVSSGGLVLGMLTGVSFIVSMLLMTSALELADVGLILTAFRLSILIPVLAAVFLWGEPVTATQIAGIGLALAALVLMTATPHAHGRRRWRDLILALGVFGSQGVSQVCMHGIHHSGLDDERLNILLITATTAGTLGAVVVGLRRRPSAPDLRMGAGIGIFNLVALATILTALTQIDGTIFFPVMGCAVVILDNIFAHFFWKEQLGLLKVIGAGFGALSMLLVL